MRRILDEGIEWVSAGLVAALAVVVFIQVFNRFVLQTPLAWSEDLAMLLFQWVAFMGAALGVKRMRHFGIELVVKELPAKVRHGVELLVPVIMGLVGLTMIIQGLTLVRFNRARIYSTMDLSYIWAYLPIPLSGGLILAYLVRHEVQRWRSRGAEGPGA